MNCGHYELLLLQAEVEKKSDIIRDPEREEKICIYFFTLGRLLQVQRIKN